MLRQAHYLSGHLSTSRSNRRLQALADWLSFILATRAEVFRHGEVCVLDGMPLPVCTRVRARRWGKVRGHISCGYCAAKYIMPLQGTRDACQPSHRFHSSKKSAWAGGCTWAACQRVCPSPSRSCPRPCMT